MSSISLRKCVLRVEPTTESGVNNLTITNYQQNLFFLVSLAKARYMNSFGEICGLNN